MTASNETTKTFLEAFTTISKTKLIFAATILIEYEESVEINDTTRIEKNIESIGNVVEPLPSKIVQAITIAIAKEKQNPNIERAISNANLTMDDIEAVGNYVKIAMDIVEKKKLNETCT